MKCKYLFLLISAIILVSCGMDHDAINQQIYQESVKYNAEQQLGITIDPNQTWNAIKEGSITVTADADLEDIVKVLVQNHIPFDTEGGYELKEDDIIIAEAAIKIDGKLIVIDDFSDRQEQVEIFENHGYKVFTIDSFNVDEIKNN